MCRSLDILLYLAPATSMRAQLRQLDARSSWAWPREARSLSSPRPADARTVRVTSECQCGTAVGVRIAGSGATGACCKNGAFSPRRCAGRQLARPGPLAVVPTGPGSRRRHRPARAPRRGPRRLAALPSPLCEPASELGVAAHQKRSSAPLIQQARWGAHWRLSSGLQPASV
jgi:hypothetical protein